MKSKYSVNIGCRLGYSEHQKFLRIQKKKGLSGDTAVMRFLINDYENEDTDIRKIKSLLERIENSIENNQDDVGVKTQSVNIENKSNDSEVTIAMLKILVALAKANPRVLATLQTEMPEMFND